MEMSNIEKEIFSDRTAKNLEKALEELRKTQDFSFNGLKFLHDKTFTTSSDLPKLVQEEMNSYYPMRPERDDWKKTRHGLTPYSYETYYSPLEKEDFINAEKAINEAKPENMMRLSFDEKIKRLTQVYKEIDYLHAFWDGNSRVNRAFVSEMANASGIEIDFSKITQKEMYVARDKSLAEINLERRAEQLKSSYMKPNPYIMLVDTLKELNQYYPNIDLYSIFKSASREIESSQKEQKSFNETYHLTFGFDSETRGFQMRINNQPAQRVLAEYPEILNVLKANPLLSAYSDEQLKSGLLPKIEGKRLMSMTIDQNGKEIKSKDLER